MTIAWSPGVRDKAISGVVALLARADWAPSATSHRLRAVVHDALRDPNPLVRMLAAEGILTLQPESEWAERAAAVGEVLLGEDDAAVRHVLLRKLGRCVHGAPEVVDRVLQSVFAGGAAPARAVQASVAEEDELTEVALHLLTHLAMVERTPFASEAAERWCAAAPTHHQNVAVIARTARGLLRPGAPGGGDEAFRLLGMAAFAAAEAWDIAASAPEGAGLTEDQRAGLRGAAEVTHEIAQQLYFASGAHEERRGAREASDGDGPPANALSAFADRAMPLLRSCMKVPEPQGIHYAVQTAVFLAPLDELRALQLIAEAVSAHAEYSSDVLAAGEVLPYLHRLLADQRDLVLHEDDGVDAFRRVLAAFAGAGNQEALKLAYAFSEVFR